MKKHDAIGIGTIVLLIVGLLYSWLFGDVETILGRLLETTSDVTLAPEWDQEPEEGEIVTLTIKDDGDIIKHSDTVRLQGDIEFTGKKDDKLVLQRQEGIWTEIGRYFAADEELDNE